MKPSSAAMLALIAALFPWAGAAAADGAGEPDAGEPMDEEFLLFLGEWGDADGDWLPPSDLQDPNDPEPIDEPREQPLEEDSE